MQYLRHALHVDGEQFVSLYLGDDITDEDAFRTLQGKAGIGVVVADLSDSEEASRTTAADFLLESIDEVELFLTTLVQ